MRVDYGADVHAHLIDVYGEAVTWHGPYGQVPAPPLVGIFDRHHEVILDEVKGSDLDAPGHSTTMPVLAVRLASFSAPPEQGDELTIGSERFSVFDVQPDGHGMADLVLRLA